MVHCLGWCHRMTPVLWGFHDNAMCIGYSCLPCTWSRSTTHSLLLWYQLGLAIRSNQPTKMDRFCWMIHSGKLTNRHGKSQSFLVNTIQNGGFSYCYVSLQECIDLCQACGNSMASSTSQKKNSTTKLPAALMRGVRALSYDFSTHFSWEISNSPREC